MIYNKEYCAGIKSDHDKLNEENIRFLTNMYNIIMLCIIAYTTLGGERPLIHMLN